jgi:nitroreductase
MSSTTDALNEAQLSDLSTNPVYAAVADIIRQRRTIKQFLPKPVPHALMQELLDLATWAPNHRLTEPWRFYVLDGAARRSRGNLEKRSYAALCDYIAR